VSLFSPFFGIVPCFQPFRVYFFSFCVALLPQPPRLAGSQQSISACYDRGNKYLMPSGSFFSCDPSPLVSYVVSEFVP
jgi:hypothetical protein